MQILVEHEDGTKTILFERGDRVCFIRTNTHEWMFPEVGALGTVIRRSRPHPKNNGNPSSIDFLDVRTDEMAAGGWGTIHVPPWNLLVIDSRLKTHRLMITFLPSEVLDD